MKSFLTAAGLALVCLLGAVFYVLGQEEGAASYNLYYLDHDETCLKRMPFYYENASTDDLLRQLMTKLNERERQGDGHSLLPGEVTISAYTISEGVLDLEFSESYRQVEPAREILLRAGVVHTFLQVPDITGVSFRIGSSALLNSKGEEIGVMDAADFADFSDDPLTPYRYDSFTLYFADRDGKHLVEETRNVYYRRNLRRERVLVEQLAKGPMEKDHYPTISESTIVNDVRIVDKVCYVDLNGAFVDYQEDVPARTAVYSVVNSLIASGDIVQVQILIDGDEHRTMDDNISLYHYYKWNSKILETE